MCDMMYWLLHSHPPLLTEAYLLCAGVLLSHVTRLIILEVSRLSCSQAGAREAQT